MPLSHLDEFILALLTGLVMAILLAVLGLWAWAIPKLLRGEPLLSSIPILPLGPARWGGRTVSAVILLYLAANLVAGLGYGAVTGVRSPRAGGRSQRGDGARRRHRGRSTHRPDRTTDGPANRRPTPSPGHSSFTLMLLNAIGSLLVADRCCPRSFVDRRVSRFPSWDSRGSRGPGRSGWGRPPHS